MAQHTTSQNSKNKFKKGGSGKKALQKKKGNEEQKSDNSEKEAKRVNFVWAGELGDCDSSPVPMRMVKSNSKDSTVAPVHDWMLDSGAGLIRLDVQCGKFLDLPAVRYAPGGSVNLISQRLLEKEDWKPLYSDTDDEHFRCKYFDKDETRLEFKKKEDGFYWMKASPQLKASMMVARAVGTLEDNLVMK
ncbi:hypothetical protein PHMEG_0003424 [Phytophthora megakarya]|uniref:Uncharacterized protein n=1 Tax=Phytophthora megakarya TaxID=4795 RepID=A0A225WW77_9STRA|nr:hypothetical protein PHMEG_0003424 [Phytophthora megakarya]